MSAIVEHLPISARDVYEAMKDLPIISPHGHCNPAWWANDKAFPDPATLLIVPDHYIFRMLYSQGVALKDLGVGMPVKERDPRAIFQIFANHWHCFLGTPCRRWIEHTLYQTLGVTTELGLCRKVRLNISIVNHSNVFDRSLFQLDHDNIMISFKGSHYPKDVILYAVFFYVRYAVSYRDLEEIMAERGVEVDHTTLNGWVVKFNPLIACEAQRRKSATSNSWRKSATYIKIKGKWNYYYRAVDKGGKTLDFMLSEKRDAKAARRFFKQAIDNHDVPGKVADLSHLSRNHGRR